MKLKPCPFCGQPPVLQKMDRGASFYQRYRRHDWRVHCDNASKCLSMVFTFWMSRAEAIKAWNTREEEPNA